MRPEDETTGIFESGDFEGLGEIKFPDHTIIKAHFRRGVWSADRLVYANGKYMNNNQVCVMDGDWKFGLFEIVKDEDIKENKDN